MCPAVSRAVCLAASHDGDAGNPGVLWDIPTLCVTPHSCPSHGGAAKDCGDNQARGDERREGSKRQGDDLRASCQQEITVEVYNTADMDTGLSIEGFEAEMLGVLRIKLSDIWTQEIRPHPTAGCQLADAQQAGLGESGEGKAGSTKPDGHSDATLHACDAAETRCRTDRWFGGIVSPSCSFQHDSSVSGRIPASGDYMVEARLEASWVGCALDR